MEEKIMLDKTVPIPLYYQVKNWLITQIKNERYPVGTCIPSENQLMGMFGVSRTTIRQAIAEMVQEGWLYRNSTKGTIVSKPKRNSTRVRAFEPFNEQVIRAGQTPKTEVKVIEIISAPENIAGILHVQPGDKVIHMFRCRFADDTVVVTIRSYLPYVRCGFILAKDFEKESLYNALKENEDTRTYNVHQIVEAQMPTPEDMALFGINAAIPILSFTCEDSNSKGEVVSYNILRYRGDCIKFEVDIVEGKFNRGFVPPEADA